MRYYFYLSRGLNRVLWLKKNIKIVSEQNLFIYLFISAENLSWEIFRDVRKGDEKVWKKKNYTPRMFHLKFSRSEDSPYHIPHFPPLFFMQKRQINHTREICFTLEYQMTTFLRHAYLNFLFGCSLFLFIIQDFI